LAQAFDWHGLIYTHRSHMFNTQVTRIYTIPYT
jgi:hypothetical protein